MFDRKSKPIQKSDWIPTSKANQESSDRIEESIDSQSKQNKESQIKSLEVIEASRKAIALSGAKPNQISTDPTLRPPPNNKRINRNIKPNWDESKKIDRSMMRASDTVPFLNRSIEYKPISIKSFSSDAEEKDRTVELQVKPIERVKDRLEEENNNLPLQIKPIARLNERLEKKLDAKNLNPDRSGNILTLNQETVAVEQRSGEPGIILKPAIDFAVPGTTITYYFDKGEDLAPNHFYQYRWEIHNDKAALQRYRSQGLLNRLNFGDRETIQGPSTSSFEVTWDLVGKHRVICYRYTQGKLTDTFEYVQEVRDPVANAEKQFDEKAATALQPEVYLAQLELRKEILQNADPQKNADKIEQLDEAIASASEKLGVSEKEPRGNSYPLKAILVPKDIPNSTVPLQLYLRRVGLKEQWEIVDLTNPAPDAARTYSGTPDPNLLPSGRARDGIRNAWQNFLENTPNPAGQIVASLPAELSEKLGFEGEQQWNGYSNGISGYQQVRQWLSGVGFGAGLGAIALTVAPIPGSRVAAGWLLLTSGVASAGAGALNLADKLEHGNFQWNGETYLDLADIVGGLAVGTQAGILLRGNAVKVTQLQSAILISESVETGSDLAGGVIISGMHYRRIEEIRQTVRDEKKRKELILDELRKAAATGGLILLGMAGVGGKKGKKQNNRNIRITESGYGTVKKGTRDAIEISQQELKDLRNFGLTTDEVKLLESGSISKADRQALIDKHKAAFQTLITNFNVENVNLLVQRLQGKALRKIYEAANNEGLQLVLDLIALERKGKVFEFDDWVKFLSEGNKSNEQVYNIVVELKETKRLAKELKEGEIIRIGGDERKTIDWEGNKQSSFDITVENQKTKEIDRNVEVTTVNRIRDFGDLTQGITHAIEKRVSGVKTGTVEATIEIPSIPDRRGIGGNRAWYYDPNSGNFVIVERDGTIRTPSQNVFQRIADNLPTIEEIHNNPRNPHIPSASEINPNINTIDRVNIIDSSGSLVVAIVKENGVWVVKR